jgi:hypothetical protein
MESNKPLSEQYAEIGAQWVDADAAASLLEDCKSAFLSQKMQLYGDKPLNRAEAIVKASPEWRDYIEKMVNARKNANILRVKMDTLKMRHQQWIGEDANRRVEARL